MTENMENKVYLDIMKGPFAGQRFYFHEQDTFMVGRASDCALAIRDDKTLSRHHMMLEINQGNVSLRDLGSLNGTRVNTKLIRLEKGLNRDIICPPEALRDGDHITVGSTAMQIHIDYPIYCVECDKEIPPEERDKCEFINGAYVCVSCRKTEADVKVSEENEGDDSSKYFRLNRMHYENVEQNPGKVLEDLLREYLQSHERQGKTPQIYGYTELKVLGEGGYGLVYRARRATDGKIVAVKTMLQTRKPEKRKLQLF